MTDPQLAAHHLRLSAITDERLKYLTSLSNVVVVQHEEANRKHLHCYIVHTKPITRKTFVTHLKSHSAFTELNGQKDFMVSDPNTLESYWRYTMSGYKVGGRNVYDDFAKDGATCLHYDISGSERLPDYPVRGNTNQIIVQNNTQNIPQKKTITTQEKQNKFFIYCDEYFNDKLNDDEINYFNIAKLLYAYAKGGFNEHAAPQYIEYAMYNLLSKRGESAKLEESRMDWCQRVLARLKK